MDIGCSGRESLGRVGLGHAWFGMTVVHLGLGSTLVRVAMYPSCAVSGATPFFVQSLVVWLSRYVRVHPPAR